MKRILFLTLLLFASGAAICQTMPTTPSQSNRGLSILDYLKAPNVFIPPADTLNYGSNEVGMVARKNDVVYLRVLVDGVRKWIPIGGSGGTVPSGPITSLAYIGLDPNTTNVGDWIKNVFYRAQPPLATLTGGNTVELMGSGPNLTYNLSWSATRQAASQPISSVVVGGVSKTVGNVSPGGTVSGTQSVSVARNTNTTFQNVVTTSDGQTATASTSVSFLPKRYFGWVISQTPNDAAIIAAGGELSNSNAKTWTQAAPPGERYLVYAYPASLGNLSHFDINGFPSIESMSLTQRNLTNASGYTQLYNIYVTYNAQNADASVVAY